MIKDAGDTECIYQELKQFICTNPSGGSVCLSAISNFCDCKKSKNFSNIKFKYLANLATRGNSNIDYTNAQEDAHEFLKMFLGELGRKILMIENEPISLSVKLNDLFNFQMIKYGMFKSILKKT